MKEIKRILRKNGLKGYELAKMIGMSLDHYYRCSMPRSKANPKWVDAFLVGYELGLKNGRDE